jgi:hypothetical protein
VTETGRTRWTDDRIDDLALGLRNEMREVRAEMREGFRELRAEMLAMRTELHGDIRQLYGEVAINRRRMMSMWVTTLLGFAGLIVEASLR